MQIDLLARAIGARPRHRAHRRSSLTPRPRPCPHTGMWVEWMRYAGWILTCPVLLMTLVSMTTEDGTKAATVRLVPLLVANLTMVLLGITAAANLAPVKWYVFSLALCFGGHVFSSAIHCFLALYENSPNAAVRSTSLTLCLTFLGGWGCFPAAFLSGHSGFSVVSTDVQWALFVIGDLFSKNCWVALAVRRQFQLDAALDNLEANVVGDVEIADSSAAAPTASHLSLFTNPPSRRRVASRGAPTPPPPGSRLIARRGSNSDIILDEMSGSHSGRRGGTGLASPECACATGMTFQQTVQVSLLCCEAQPFAPPLASPAPSPPAALPAPRPSP